MADVAGNYLRVCDHVRELALKCGRNPTDVTVVAVSKTYPLDHILPAYNAGCRDFGESKVQEALPKCDAGPQDLRWHMIGSLQRKKVPKVVGKFALVHSVDTPELAQKLSQSSRDAGVKTAMLLQVNTSGEETKHGMSPEAWDAHIGAVLELDGIDVQGLMTMAPLTENTREVAACFAGLRNYRDKIQQDHGVTLPHLSMGMTHDYPIAIAEGATLLRVGTAIFGER